MVSSVVCAVSRSTCNVREKRCLHCHGRCQRNQLRQNLYNILDSVVDTGVPVEIERNGRLLRIVAEEQGSKWDRLTAHQVVVGDPDDLVHVDWFDEWHGENVR